jgi:type VI secretion system secreted protein Hcp
MALVDIFLKLDGVDGESPDTQHAGEIQLDGFRLSATSPRDVETGGASGAVRMSHFGCTSKVDKATPKLFDKITKNSKIPTAVLTCRKAGKDQFEFLKITLTDVFVAKVQMVRGEGGDDVVPQCEFDLAYGKIEAQYREQTPRGPTTGPVVFTHDLRSNR